MLTDKEKEEAEFRKAYEARKAYVNSILNKEIKDVAALYKIIYSELTPLLGIMAVAYELGRRDQAQGIFDAKEDKC